MGEQIIFSRMSISPTKCCGNRRVSWAVRVSLLFFKCIISSKPLQRKFHFPRHASLLALQKSTVITFSEFNTSRFYSHIVTPYEFAVCHQGKGQFKDFSCSRCLLFIFSSSSHPSSLLLPAAPGPGGCIRSVGDLALCHRGLPWNGTVDQRWPGTGRRERSTRYYHWLLLSSPLLFLLLPSLCLVLSLSLSVLLQLMPGLIRNQVSLCQPLGFYTNEWWVNNVLQTGQLLLHAPNFNLLFSILTLVRRWIINWLLPHIDI